ncbi:MAG: hypothetical protein ACFFDH_08440 [Promethearchaeota archaeon]
MIIKTKVKSHKKDNKKVIIVWIQNHKDFDKDLQDLLNFFKDQVKYTIVYRIRQFYKITSNNPAIMFSLISSIQDIIAESYFNTEEPIELQEPINFQL